MGKVWKKSECRFYFRGMTLNFLGAAILNLMTCNGCRYCYSAEVLLCKTIEQPYYVMKSKMVVRGKFKYENSR